MGPFDRSHCGWCANRGFEEYMYSGKDKTRFLCRHCGASILSSYDPADATLRYQLADWLIEVMLSGPDSELSTLPSPF